MFKSHMVQIQQEELSDLYVRELSLNPTWFRYNNFHTYGITLD